ncbi:MAG: hypothetical protein FJ404_01890 [Verrucomicrobia bacterium]|nr:hypothetical protein [Verrucomicrobiota bacterium]
MEPTSHASHGHETPATPFLGLMAVLISLLVANVLQTLNLIGQRGEMLQAQKRQVAMLPEARLLQSQIEPRLELFSRDLVQMSATNDTARQLVNHFGITWTPNPAAAGTNKPPAAPNPSNTKGRSP